MPTSSAEAKPTPGIVRQIALSLNAVFPFLHPMRYLVTGRTLIGIARYLRDAIRYRRAERIACSGFEFSIRHAFAVPHDWFEQAGSPPRHYFLQDLWAARKVRASGVKLHYDIGSRLDGFIGHCLAFTDVVMLDVRKLTLRIPGLSFQQADCMNMAGIASNSIESLSSLHAIEHFGLGRYGDPIDPLGHEKALREMQRVVAPGGDIYLGVPIGTERLEFNAQRVFHPGTIVKFFKGCELIEFSVIDDEDALHEAQDPAHWSGLSFGCGLFHFRKA